MNTERPGDEQYDAMVSRAWRAASVETPTPHVDDAILAAARAEAERARVREPPSSQGGTDSAWPSWLTRWQPLAAAAAVAGLAFLLVQLLPGEREVDQPVPFEATEPAAPAAPSATESSPVVAPAERSSSYEADAPSPGRDAALAAPAASPPEAAERETAPAVPSAPAMVPAPASGSSEPEASDASVGTATTAPRNSAEGFVQEATQAPAAAGAPAASRTRSDTGLAPAQWAERIESLHDDGDAAGAARELRAFRKEYADADQYLPEELRSWAASVK